MPRKKNVIRQASDAVSQKIFEALLDALDKRKSGNLYKIDIEKVLYPVLAPLVDALNSVRADAQMALVDDWDRSDSGFESQIIMIERVCPQLNEEYVPEN